MCDISFITWLFVATLYILANWLPYFSNFLFFYYHLKKLPLLLHINSYFETYVYEMKNFSLMYLVHFDVWYIKSGSKKSHVKRVHFSADHRVVWHYHNAAVSHAVCHQAASDCLSQCAHSYIVMIPDIYNF